jgi:hypothetical protein
MKRTTLRLALLTLFVLAVSFTGTTPASAAVAVNIAIGGPPPPRPTVIVQPWARPYRSAVWIQPHYEAINGRWVWVNGYYAYPPRRGGVWVDGYYRHGYYRPGHWRY